MLLRVAEQAPMVSELSKEEQFEILNKSVQDVAKLVTDAGADDYMMDTETIGAMWAQQLSQNQENYWKLLRLSNETRRAIENAPISLSYKEKVRLQQRSVQIQLTLGNIGNTSIFPTKKDIAETMS
jgi:hypothetical protein